MINKRREGRDVWTDMWDDSRSLPESVQVRKIRFKDHLDPAPGPFCLPTCLFGKLRHDEMIPRYRYNWCWYNYTTDSHDCIRRNREKEMRNGAWPRKHDMRTDMSRCIVVSPGQGGLLWTLTQHLGLFISEIWKDIPINVSHDVLVWMSNCVKISKILQSLSQIFTSIEKVSFNVNVIMAAIDIVFSPTW